MQARRERRERNGEHVARLRVARVGDHDGLCTLPTGCASGQYWCSLRVISGGGSVEPVLELQTRYNSWRNLQMPVRADQLLTRVFPTARRLPAEWERQAKQSQTKP